MQAILSRLTTASVCFVLAACGGSSSNSVSNDLAGDGVSLSSGFLIGPRVTGLGYGSGITSTGGEFTLSGSSTLDFKLGALELGSVQGRSRLSLYDVVGSAQQYRFDKAVRVGRLLLSLDDDADVRNGVQLDNTKAAAGELDWQSSDSLWEAAASSLVYRLGSGTQTLWDEQQALQIITLRLRGEGESCSSDLNSTVGFSIADPRCSDRARMMLWREDLSVALQKLQSGVDQLLDQQATVPDWWAQIKQDNQDLIGQHAEIQAWLGYAFAGADVPLRQAIENGFAGDGSLSTELQTELERWRSGGGRALRARDKLERQLGGKVLDTWLGYGFDLSAMHSALGLGIDSRWDELIRAVAAREGLSITQERLAVVDQQVYLALQLIDASMNQRASWVTGGSAVNDNLSGDDASTGGGQSNSPARVWRVAYDALVSGTSVGFTVEGSGLDDQVNLILASCSNIRALSGTEGSRQFSCDLNGDAGGRILQVVDDSDGSLLYESIVSVEAGSNTGGGTATAVVHSVSPVKAERSSTQLFSVRGQDFPLDMRFSLAGCSGAQVQSRSSTQLDVLCQLDDRATVRTGRVELADGTEIYQFNISPISIDEASIRVVEVAPAAALESETLEMTISGSGFGSSAQVETAACESILLVSRTDAEITFSCRHAQIGTWPAYVVSDQQTIVAPQSIQVRAVEAIVSSVSPLIGVEGEWVNLQISGQHLSTGLSVELGTCPELEALDGTPVLRQYGCTPATVGIHQGRVLAGGKVLYRFDFTVEAASSTQLISVSPTSSFYGKPLELTFRGEGLDELAQVEMESCFNMALLRASSTEMVFSCTPQSIGSFGGRLLDRNGEELVSFTAAIVDGQDPLDSVVLDSIKPLVTYLGAETTFTVRGKDLPASLVLSVEGCTEVVQLGGQGLQRQFRCTPRGASGPRQMNVYASGGGALLGTFELQVTGNELRVNDITPSQTAIGVITLIRVSGQNLSSAMVLDLEGCDARLTTSSSTDLRTYRCVPYGVSGTRSIRVLDRLGGTVLYSGTIEMLPAP